MALRKDDLGEEPELLLEDAEGEVDFDTAELSVPELLLCGVDEDEEAFGTPEVADELRLSVGEDDELEMYPGLLELGLLTYPEDDEELCGTLEVVVELMLLLREDDELAAVVSLLDPGPLLWNVDDNEDEICETLEEVEELSLLVEEGGLEEVSRLLDPGLVLEDVEDDEEGCGTLGLVDELGLLFRDVDELVERPRLLLLEDRADETVSAALRLDTAELYLLLKVIADDMFRDKLAN